MASEAADRHRGVTWQIPRNTLALLMVAQAVAVVPFLFHLSPWIVGVGLFCGYWRTGVYLGRWDYPRRWIKVVLVLASVGGVGVSGVEVFSLEAAASVLLLAFGLKLIEMKGRRDAYVVIFLGYFIIATQFLFDQSVGVTAYQLGAAVVVTAAMVSLNQLDTRVRPLESLRVAVVLIAQALPLTVVLFLLFPRIAPLWTVPVQSSSKTGMSDHMKPGDVAQLIRSDELAFRAVFPAGVPPNRELYWRGLTYSRFRDGTWSVGGLLPQWEQPPPQEPSTSRQVTYEVLLEPTQSNWLYALEVPFTSTDDVTLSRDYRLEAEDPVLSVFRYRVTSDSGLAMDEDGLPDVLRARETLYPEDDNRRLQAFARSLWRSTGTPDAFVAAVLQHIRGETYFYTLSPPRLEDRNSIDAFWFDTRRGFCTHYAGALVFMLRSLDIPARMVGGYQGGEVNPVTGHLMVRQYDAHAWAEYWVAGRGWQRVDPTSAVAPARIEQGLNAALSAEDRASLSAFTSARFQGVGLFRDVLLWADSLEHRWNLWVVGYDPQMQGELLKELLGEVTPARLGAAVLIGGALSLGLVAVVMFWRRRPVARHPAERVFSTFCDRVAGAGWRRAPAESPGAFITRIAQSGALRAEQARSLVAELERVLYNPAASWDRRDLRRLQGQLRRLQFRLVIGSVR